MVACGGSTGWGQWSVPTVRAGGAVRSIGGVHVSERIVNAVVRSTLAFISLDNSVPRHDLGKRDRSRLSTAQFPQPALAEVPLLELISKARCHRPKNQIAYAPPCALGHVSKNGGQKGLAAPGVVTMWSGQIAHEPS